jgi:hypothetical protein
MNAAGVSGRGYFDGSPDDQTFFDVLEADERATIATLVTIILVQCGTHNAAPADMLQHFATGAPPASTGTVRSLEEIQGPSG